MLVAPIQNPLAPGYKTELSSRMSEAQAKNHNGSMLQLTDNCLIGDLI